MFTGRYLLSIVIKAINSKLHILCDLSELLKPTLGEVGGRGAV